MTRFNTALAALLRARGEIIRDRDRWQEQLGRAGDNGPLIANLRKSISEATDEIADLDDALEVLRKAGT